MHELSSAFVLGYHGCDHETAEKLLLNQPFQPSNNDYDWLGPGIYFWEANPDRARDWARYVVAQKKRREGIIAEPAVVGAVLNPGFCLDLISSNGIEAVEQAFATYRRYIASTDAIMPQNTGGEDLLARNLDCAVIKFLHEAREQSGNQPFDTVRGVFMEGQHIYENSGFRHKTHIQISVRNPEMIKGVFRVPKNHFTQP